MFVLHIKRERIKPLEHSLCYISPLVKVFWDSDKGALEELSARVSVIEIEEEEKSLLVSLESFFLCFHST